MKKFTRYTLAMSALLIALPAQAGCPTLSSQELGNILTPISGLAAFTSPSADSVTYEREHNISGAAKNLWAGFRKRARDDGKTYSGVESNLKPGKLVCKYNLPPEWQKAAEINELELTADIKQPISKEHARCPSLKFSDVSQLQCHGRLKDTTMWSYHTEKKGTLESKFEGFCQMLTGAMNKLSEVESNHSINGQLTPETTAFTHTCKYEYHIGSKPEELTIYGKMDLEALRVINAPRGRYNAG